MNLSEPQTYFLTSDRDINLFLAGIGSGKTFIGGVISYYFLSNFPDARGFIAANTHMQLNTSTMVGIREAWKVLFGWSEGTDYVVGKKPPASFDTETHNFDSYHGIMSFRNGAVVFVGSLENAKAHDGKQFCWAILDETKDSREEDVKEVILGRLRQLVMGFDEGNSLVRADSRKVRPFNPLYILTSPAKVPWIADWFELEDFRPEIESSIYSKETFFGKTWKDKCVAISSTWHNASNLPAGYIERVLANNTNDAGKMLIYGNPFSRTGGEFYTGFERMQIVREFGLEKSTLHISFDQNVVPYITATVWQLVKIDDYLTEIRCISEFCLANPRNTTERLCQEIMRVYSNFVIENGQSVIFYGDASGNKRSTQTVETDYTIVERELRTLLVATSNRTVRKNPPVGKRRDFINNLLEGRVQGHRIAIHPKCKELIADLTYLKEDSDGKKKKEKAKDPVTGIVSEKYGHTSDSMDYLLTGILASQFDRFCHQFK